MSSDWVYPLDMCASAGILDYDAPAFILDQPARYVGNPKFDNIPTTLLPDDVKMKKQPQKDGFDNPSNNVIENPSWKKWLFGGITAAAVIGTTLALGKGKLKIPASVKNYGSTVLNYVKKPFIWIANKFKRTP